MKPMICAQCAAAGLARRVGAVAAVLASALLSACVTVAQAPVTPAAPAGPTGISWQKGSTQSYEAQSPGLGVSQRYNAAQGWIDVYSYDLQRKNWREGTGDAQFAQHFESTVDEVRYLGKQGRYADLKVGAVRDTDVFGQRFRTVSFQFGRDGQAMRSATYLTAYRGRLLKYRVSIYAATGLDADVVAREFVESHMRTDPALRGA